MSTGARIFVAFNILSAGYYIGFFVAQMKFSGWPADGYVPSVLGIAPLHLGVAFLYYAIITRLTR